MRSFEKHAGPNFRNACDALGINASAQNTMGAQMRLSPASRNATNTNTFDTPKVR